MPKLHHIQAAKGNDDCSHDVIPAKAMKLSPDDEIIALDSGRRTVVLTWSAPTGAFFLEREKYYERSQARRAKSYHEVNNGSNKSWMKSNRIDAKQPACSMQWTSLLRKIEDGTRNDRSRLSRRLQGIRACQLTSRSGGCRLIIPSCAKQAGNVKKRCTTKSCCVAIRRWQACSSWKGEGGVTLRQGA